MNSGRIDFTALAVKLVQRADTLVPKWLPGGNREGPEWKCGSVSGEARSSCSINLQSGQLGDFATDDKGGDLTSLYAAINGMSQGGDGRHRPTGASGCAGASGRCTTTHGHAGQ